MEFLFPIERMSTIDTSGSLFSPVASQPSVATVTITAATPNPLSGPLTGATNVTTTSVVNPLSSLDPSYASLIDFKINKEKIEAFMKYCILKLFIDSLEG